MQTKRSQQDPLNEKYIFSSDDLRQQEAALDEFQTRHSTITEKINETYKIGNQMMDYLEKQIILDHHFRGEQDQFEQEYERLKAKAIKLLGHDTYYACSPLTGSPLTEDENPELFEKLMQIQTKISNDLDGNLAKHNVRIDQFEDNITNNTASLEDGPNQDEQGEEIIDEAPEIEAAEAATQDDVANSDAKIKIDPEAAISAAEEAEKQEALKKTMQEQS